MKAHMLLAMAVLAITTACAAPIPAGSSASANASTRSPAAEFSSSEEAQMDLNAVCGDAGKAFAAESNFPNIDISSPETILRDAEADFVQVYGKADIEGEKPLKLTAYQDMWLVEGQMPPPPPGMKTLGGVAMMAIDGKDGKVLCFIHGV